MRRLLLTAALAVAAAALPATAAAAQTAVPGPHLAVIPVQQTSSAVTFLTGRPDSGNGGTWMTADLTRVLTLTLTGTTGTGSAKLWHYTAQVIDQGRGQAIKGALTPNQAPGVYAGDTIRSAALVGVKGTAAYSFTASQPAQFGFNSGVPFFEVGAPKTVAEQTPFWYEQAFAPGTVFGGPGIGTWGWTYLVPFPHEQWVDSSANGGGNVPSAGNIG